MGIPSLDLSVRERVFRSKPRPCLLHEGEWMLPTVSIPMLIEDFLFKLRVPNTTKGFVDIKTILDFYFQLCSLEMTTESM